MGLTIISLSMILCIVILLAFIIDTFLLIVLFVHVGKLREEIAQCKSAPSVPSPSKSYVDKSLNANEYEH